MRGVVQHLMVHDLHVIGGIFWPKNGSDIVDTGIEDLVVVGQAVPIAKLNQKEYEKVVVKRESRMWM